MARARVLREVEGGWAETEISETLGVSYNTIRSHVDDLKVLTGCSDVRELARWWRDYRGGWLAWCAEQGGVPPGEGRAS
jgi:DNA-binding NarL/FixJ family response regulator